jgi:hypothetical protein
VRNGGRCSILDLGGRIDYWRDIGLDTLAVLGVTVTVVNTFEADSDEQRQMSAPGFEVLEADACSLPQFADDRFDLVHSNSCLEHVGDWGRMQAFAHETRRLAPAYYIQTPNFWFPIEPHFLTFAFHWRSEAQRVRMMMRRGHGHHPRARTREEALKTVRSARLLTPAKMRALFPDGALAYERILGIRKSIIAIRERQQA